MTIEEKIDNFRALLKYTYQAQQKENLIISSEILANNGFDLRELDEFICPSLAKGGVLRQRPSFLINSDLIEERIDHNSMGKIRDIESRIKALARTKTNDKIVEEINLDAINRLEEEKKSYIKQIPSYEFIINANEITKEARVQNNGLKSIHLVTDSLEPQDAIFLVFDENYKISIRCSVKNRMGQPTYIKKLYDIAYFVNAPGKRVNYNKGLADNINNGLFRKREVNRYMKTNGYKKPTLVQKSKDNILVLKNEILVKTTLIKNIPYQFQSLYIDKTA
ncbi:MAG: hypothetical protein AAB922_01915 [Patescibacteria group bacterium]|mgnify:CR=1 FL=1